MIISDQSTSSARLSLFQYLANLMVFHFKSCHPVIQNLSLIFIQIYLSIFVEVLSIMAHLSEVD